MFNNSISLANYIEKINKSHFAGTAHLTTQYYLIHFPQTEKLPLILLTQL